MGTGGIILVALAIAVGIIGIIVPLLPGTLLVFGAIAVWAVFENNVVTVGGRQEPFGFSPSTFLWETCTRLLELLPWYLRTIIPDN